MTQTEWFLLARYQGLPIIPVDRVIADFFPTLGKAVFLRKILDGSIKLPVVRMEASQKGAKGIYLSDLARYIDGRHEEATRDFQRMHG
ncbi:Pyocin activator protein PrtN [Cereibacter sphaeroides]|uniref:Pyocin activator protein PrtN n=1 Tax=Cereibacter sphaeroides TaxID=1063 RepID=A0AAX1UMF6_CERSP|nr:pyocin activator PrtN family protein [Cereibacter sphaeroides]RHZ95800.1 Pyocin activator protein PrtN [Cereibacter sphaeroides]